MNDQLNSYQLTYLLSLLLDEKGVLEIGQKLKKWIEEKQGKIEEEKTITRILAYPIKKYQQAVYSNLFFRALPQSIDEFQEFLKLEGNILRYAIQKKPIFRSLFKAKKSASAKIGLAKIYSSSDLFRQTHPKETGISEINLDRSLKKELTEKPISSPPQKEKVKLEELDKKLEEILNE